MLQYGEAERLVGQQLSDGGKQRRFPPLRPPCAGLPAEPAECTHGLCRASSSCTVVPCGDGDNSCTEARGLGVGLLLPPLLLLGGTPPTVLAAGAAEVLK